MVALTAGHKARDAEAVTDDTLCEKVVEDGVLVFAQAPISRRRCVLSFVA